MLRNTLIIFVLTYACFATAQEVVSTQGNSYSNGVGSIDYTIGEVVIITGTDGTNDITQGFHQTNWNFVGLIDNDPEYQVSIFPNPTSEVINIKTTVFEDVTYSLFDASGKLIVEDKLSADQTTIKVDELAPGNYTLTLAKGVQILKTFKLVKVQ